MLQNPRINFAISTGHSVNGIEHLGLQADSREELREIYRNMEKSKRNGEGRGRMHLLLLKVKEELDHRSSGSGLGGLLYSWD